LAGSGVPGREPDRIAHTRFGAPVSAPETDPAPGGADRLPGLPLSRALRRRSATTMSA